MADATNLSIFGQETYFNEKINAFTEIETPILNATQEIETPKIIITQEFNGIGITASNSYGTRYVSVGSTPSTNSVGNNGDIWYTV